MVATTTKGSTGVAVAVITPKEAGRAWLQLQLDAVLSLSALVGRAKLDRTMLAKDIARGRTTNAALLGESIADAATHGADPVAVGAIAQRVASWFRTLVSQARVSLVDCWERETREQVEADLAQRRAMTSNDPSVLAHAIAETDEHLASAQLLRDALAARHTALTARCA
jgi:hypothetical protein